MLTHVGVPWWFAGGWAIDLFLGRTHRTHDDLDVGCFRQDAAHIIRFLTGWEIRGPVDGALVPIDRSVTLHATIHNLWCRPPSSACWVLELLLEDADGPEWIYRRDHRIRRAAADIVAQSAAGFRYMRPEIQLLYKSKGPRPRDDSDFLAAWPHLTTDARAWLTDSIAATSPGHPWLSSNGAG
jgi:hypothetical protein